MSKISLTSSGRSGRSRAPARKRTMDLDLPREDEERFGEMVAEFVSYLRSAENGDA